MIELGSQHNIGKRDRLCVVTELHFSYTKIKLVCNVDYVRKYGAIFLHDHKFLEKFVKLQNNFK